MTTVKLGSTGSDVKRLSELLGLSPRTVCDEEMVTKMKEYQKDYGLTPDGIFGYNSWKQILIAERYSKTPLGDIQKSDYSIFGWLLGCEPEMIQAFVQVESNGSGFLSGSGRPRILFESYQFWKYLKKEGKDPNKYLPENSDIITSKWVKNYKGGEKEWDRLERARKISEDAANMSTSWGLLQIMGFNYSLCGMNSVSSFVSGMAKDEFTQLVLGIEFMKSTGITKYFVSRDFKGMAKAYNGPGYASNKYDIKLKNAYYSLKRA